MYKLYSYKLFYTYSYIISSYAIKCIFKNISIDAENNRCFKATYFIKKNVYISFKIFVICIWLIIIRLTSIAVNHTWRLPCLSLLAPCCTKIILMSLPSFLIFLKLYYNSTYISHTKLWTLLVFFLCVKISN